MNILKKIKERFFPSPETKRLNSYIEVVDKLAAQAQQKNKTVKTIYDKSFVDFYGLNRPNLAGTKEFPRIPIRPISEIVDSEEFETSEKTATEYYKKEAELHRKYSNEVGKLKKDFAEKLREIKINRPL
jgi:hypothetical protein